MRVIYVFADSASEWNCSEWRCKAFSDAFNRVNVGVEAKLIHVSGFLEYLASPLQAWIGPADLIIFQRNAVSQEALDAIEYWQGMGKPVVLDLDDAYHILPWSNPAHQYWHVEDTQSLYWLERALWVSDGLIAPNPLLLQDWAHVCPGFLIPNFARREWWRPLPSREEAKGRLSLAGRIVIGWGGSVSHYDAWWGSGLREAARWLARDYPKITFLIAGNDPRIADSLPVPPSQKVALRGVPPEDWPKIVASFDIGVAPLFGPYDQRRSWIKGMEYSLAGVPWVATDGVPYAGLRAWGRLIRNSEQEWYMALADLIDRLEEAQAEAEARKEEAETLFIDRRLGEVRRIYEEIVERKRSRGRLPGVAYVGFAPEPGRDPVRTVTILSNPYQERLRISGYSHCLSARL